MNHRKFFNLRLSKFIRWACLLCSVLAANTAVAQNPPNALSNLSVRTAMASGQTIIVGAVANGPKNILVRAAGPALSSFGLGGMLDPRLELYTSNNLLLAANDDWNPASASAFSAVGAFPFPLGSKDSALNQSVSGSFTVQARGTGPGTLLIELYDATNGTASRLVNISTRSKVGTGSDILIAGFNLAGRGTRPLVIRGIGPGLSPFGVTGLLSDPTLQVFDDANRLVASNDNWNTSLASTFTSLGAFGLPENSKDSALLLTLAPGDYSAVVTGQAGATGIGLVEVYDATVGAIPRDQRIVNLSTRAIAGNTSDTILIAGFVVTGSVPKRVLIRGVGPALTQFGVAGALARPSLAVFSGSTVLAQNAGWTTTADTSAITAAAQQSGAFAFAATSQDAALILNLAPGAYTAHISGVAGTTGVALVEVYELP